MVAPPRSLANDDPSHIFVNGPIKFPQDHLAPCRANGHSPILARDHTLRPELDHEVRAARRERFDYQREQRPNAPWVAISQTDSLFERRSGNSFRLALYPLSIHRSQIRRSLFEEQIRRAAHRGRHPRASGSVAHTVLVARACESPWRDLRT